MMAGSSTRSGGASCGPCSICRVWWRALKWLPVLLIVSIVGWSYYAYVVQLCFYTVSNAAERIAYLVPYHLLFVMFLWSYWQTVLSKIAPIPNKFKLPSSELEKLLSAESEDAQRLILEHFSQDLPIVTRAERGLFQSLMGKVWGPNLFPWESEPWTMSGAVRYCNRCMLVKPDRAHHCSMCGVCVLKMDHHCPWVNNCVCFNNYKFFMLFLGYALMYCIFVMCTALHYFVQFWKKKFPNAMTGETNTGQFHVVFVFFVALMFAISLASLFGYHCYLVLHNRTTLEAFRAPMFRSGTDKNGFSIGTFNNFKEVFGRDPQLWLLPIFSSCGEGSEYPVRSEHRVLTFTSLEARGGYDAMGTTSVGEGATFPQRRPDEDTESLLSSERGWDRSRADHLDSSSFDDALE